MKFGIKKGSSRKITLKELQQKLMARKDEKNHIELFIDVCYDLAKENDFTAVIYLDKTCVFNEKEHTLKSEKFLNVKFM